jgi:toxin ParE1/3/4
VTGYVLSPRAIEDLSDIWDYSTDRWGADQADRYVRQITATCRDLADNRRKGRDAGDIRAGYFRYAVGSHELFYRYDQEGQMEVVRILHKRMDVERHL